MMKKVILLAFIIFSFSAGSVFAQSGQGGIIKSKSLESSGCLANGDVATLSCLPILLQNIINFLALFAGIVAVLLIIYAGFKFITSQGDPEKISAARNTLIYVLWGTVVVISSLLIVGIIAKFTGVSSLAPK